MDNKGRLKISLWLMVTACIIGFGLWRTDLLRQRVAPEPLALAGDEKIWGHLRIEAAGPETMLTIGAPFSVTLEVEAKPGISFDLPDLDQIGSEELLELARTLPEQTASFPEGFRKSRQYQLIAWRSGKFTIPNITLAYRENGGEGGEIRIPGQVLVVESLLTPQSAPADPTALGIKGPKSPAGLPVPYLILGWHLAAVLLVLTGAALLRKIRQARLIALSSEQALPPPEPAHEVALRQLESLKRSADLEKNDFLSFYTALSQCFRCYMADRYGINGLEMTTEEFLGWATSSRRLSGGQQQVIKEVLSRADLVKFAKTGSTPQEASKALAQLEQFVLDTRDIEPQENEAFSDLSGPSSENGAAVSDPITPDGGATP